MGWQSQCTVSPDHGLPEVAETDVCVVADGGLQGVVVESTAGRGVVRAKRLIDASGDADLVCRSGLGLTFGQDGTVQNPTMISRLGGVDVERFRAYWGEDTICSLKVPAASRKPTQAVPTNCRAPRSGYSPRLGLTRTCATPRGLSAKTAACSTPSTRRT